MLGMLLADSDCAPIIRKSGDIRLPNLVSLQAQLVERSLHVDYVPQDDARGDPPGFERVRAVRFGSE